MTMPKNDNVAARGATRMSRRAFASGAIAALTLGSATVGAQGDIEPAMSWMERLLEILPDRSSDTGEFAPIVFVDGTGPGWQRHGATDSHLLQAPTLTRVDGADLEGLLGIEPSGIEASMHQVTPDGSLRIVAGRFDSDSIEAIRAVIVGHGYTDTDPGAVLPELHRETSAMRLQDRFPTVVGIAEGHWDTIAFMDNQTLVVAASPREVQMVRDAERKRIPYMTFGPGINGIRKHEPEATYESVIVPGAYVGAVPDAPRVLSVGAFASYPESDLAPAQGVSGARATWTVIISLSWQETGRFVTREEITAYADRVEERFDAVISTRTGEPFAQLMTISDISSDHGTLIIEFLPRSSIEGYYQLTDMALNRDLGFLRPAAA